MSSFFRNHPRIRNTALALIVPMMIFGAAAGCGEGQDVSNDTQTIAAVSSEAGAVNVAQTVIPAQPGGMNLSSGHR